MLLVCMQQNRTEMWKYGCYTSRLFYKTSLYSFKKEHIFFKIPNFKKRINFLRGKEEENHYLDSNVRPCHWLAGKKAHRQDEVVFVVVKYVPPTICSLHMYRNCCSCNNWILGIKSWSWLRCLPLYMENLLYQYQPNIFTGREKMKASCFIINDRKKCIVFLRSCVNTIQS